MPHDPRTPESSLRVRNGHRRGFTRVILTIALLATVGAGAAFFLMRDTQGEGEAVAIRDETHTVARGDFVISIPANGELAAVRQVEIRNALDGRATITEVVDEGTFVRKGEVLVRFAADDIEDQLKDAEDRLTKAKGDVLNAEESLKIAISTKESELEKADVKIEIAQLALDGWIQGEHVKRQGELELDLETATINAERLEKRYQEGATLVEQGFISKDEHERDRIAMIEAQARVQQVNLDIFLYDNFKSAQDEKQKASDLEQAQAERGRIEQRQNSQIRQAQTEFDTAKMNLESAQERVTDFKEQLALASITAPTDGLVVYASSLESGGWRGNDRQPPTVGTEIRSNELIMILPDTTQMVALVKVSEALSGRITEGQPAVVFSDALPNVPIPGNVQSVSVLAEGGGWRDPNRRDYTVRILLDADTELGLKPSMRARAEIQLGEVTDALSVPIQSIFRDGRRAFVYVPAEGGFAQRAVRLGRSSELSVEIVEGLETGELVLLREPKGKEIVARLDEEDASDRRDAIPTRGNSGAPPEAPRSTASRGGA